MIQDLLLRWVVTIAFVFSAGVCVSAIVRNRHCAANLIGHSLHAAMAVAMAVMAWPWGAELPARPPMLFFLAAAVWFGVVAVRTTGHRVANGYHTLMMLAMAWMYAAMGGLTLPRQETAGSTPMTGMDSAGSSGAGPHAGHGVHGGTSSGMPSGDGPADWVVMLNWFCTFVFASAAVFWFYRLITIRVRGSSDESSSSVGAICQFAMAGGMAIMFAVML